MIANAQDIEQALLDVRKAYRLLHDYQRAALDAANYIGNQLGFTYVGGWPLFSDCAPRVGKGGLDYWAWDWLNLVCYDFNFEQNTAATGKIDLTICLMSDTGFYVSDKPQVSKIDVTSFKAAESSETKVGFLLYREWQNNFTAVRWERTAIRRFIENNGELPSEMMKAGVVGKCCSFARICDEDSADSVIDELLHLAKSKGFPLERVRKKIGRAKSS